MSRKPILWFIKEQKKVNPIDVIMNNYCLKKTDSLKYLGVIIDHRLNQGWGQVQYLYLSTYLSVLAVLEYLVYGNVKVLVLDQRVLGTYK